MSAFIATLVKGGPVMIPLVCCSVLSLAAIIERAWFWWSARAGHEAERALELAARGKWEDALNACRAARSPVARILAVGIDHRNPSATLAMEAATRDELVRLRRSLPLLDTIVTLSPLLGLLGTVTGMIGAFGVMAGSGINQPHAITGGVAEALIATAAGLGVAIATLVAHNYFSARAERTLDAIEYFGTRLEALLAEAAP